MWFGKLSGDAGWKVYPGINYLCCICVVYSVLQHWVKDRLFLEPVFSFFFTGLKPNLLIGPLFFHSLTASVLSERPVAYPGGRLAYHLTSTNSTALTGTGEWSSVKRMNE